MCKISMLATNPKHSITEALMKTQEDPVHYSIASFLPATGMLFQVPRNHDKEDIAHREGLSVYKFD